MKHEHGKFCFRCGAECNESIVMEAPHGAAPDAEAVPHRVWTCPRGCPGIQGKQQLPPEPAAEAADGEIVTEGQAEAAGSGTGRYPEGTNWTDVSDGTGYPEDGRNPTRIQEVWPNDQQKAALPPANKLPE